MTDGYVKGEMNFTDEEPRLQHKKFDVRRMTPSTRGIDHSDCRYFVLDPQHDPAAREAMMAYVQSDSVRVYRPEMARDLLEWLADVYDKKAQEE